MRSVGLKMLKNKLSHYVRLVSQGETVLVTDRDRVVAQLVPPRPGRASHVADAVLAELIRSGQISPALRGPGAPPESRPVAPLDEILAELEEDRSER